MANKGNSVKQKRLSYDGKGRILKKLHTWVIRTMPGSSSKSLSAPIGVVIRDVLKVAENVREVKYILKEKKVYVNTTRIYDKAYPVGLFDILSFKDVDKSYRVYFDSKGFLELEELKKGTKPIRYSRVASRKTLKGSKVQVNLDNGINVLTDLKLNVKDGVLYNFETKKIENVLPFGKGAQVFVAKGSHVGKSGEIVRLAKGSLGKREEAVIKGPKTEFRTLTDYIYVVPSEKKEN